MEKGITKIEKNCINEVILDKTITDSTAAKKVNVSGYRRYSILGRFEGPANGTFKIEINNNNNLVQQEFLALNDAGWLNFAKEYTVYGPDIGVVVYHPPASLKIKMSLYAGL
jgi:hypothetical protein